MSELKDTLQAVRNLTGHATPEPVTLKVPASNRAGQNAIWENRFIVKSDSSNKFYTIAQCKAKRYWACSCMAWRTKRACKHLTKLGLPPYEVPQEVIFE